MKRLLPLAFLLSGCAGPMLIGEPGHLQQASGIESRGSSPDEPSFCVTATRGTGADARASMLQHVAKFRDLRTSYKSGDGHCDVLVSVTSDGYSVFAKVTLDAFSGYTREAIWSGTGKGQFGGDGIEYLGPLLQGAFQPGQPAFDRWLKTKPRVEAAPRIAAAPAPEPAPVAHPDVAAAAVPEDLPPGDPPRPNAYAVVIGVARYRQKLPAADFADQDAKSVARYLHALGFMDANVATLINDEATKADFEKYFERWLPNHAEAGSQVFVYYSGHGAPNAKTGDAYLVPYDGDPTYIAETGYPLKKLYAELGKLPAKKITVVMDSCFSGAGGRSVIAAGARPLVNVVEAGVPAKITVLSASAGDQVSNSYREKKHGLFTYYLLKGMREDGLDFHAVYNYVRAEVSGYARRELNSDQEPQWREGK